MNIRMLESHGVADDLEKEVLNVCFMMGSSVRERSIDRGAIWFLSILNTKKMSFVTSGSIIYIYLRS